MTRHEELVEAYEDAWFALLMEQVAIIEGEELIRENERLKNDPSAEVRPEFDKRCKRTIKRAFAKQRIRKILSTTHRIFQKTAVIICAIVLLFSAIYIASPQVRSTTLNFLIENSGIQSFDIDI